MNAFTQEMKRQGPDAAAAIGAAALAFSAVLSAVLILLLLPAMYSGVLPADTSPAATDSRRDADTGLLFLTALLILGVGISRQHRAAAGLRLPPRAPLGWLLGGAALSFAGLLASGGAALLMHRAGAEYSGSSGSQWAAMTGWERLHASLAAGMHEEFFYLAVPVGCASVVAGWAGERQVRAARWSPQTAARVQTAAAVLAGVVFLVFRVGMHTYQGVAPAVGALVWASVNLALVLVLRSVVPVMVAHVLYDFTVAGGGVLYLSPLGNVLGAAGLVFLVAAGAVLARRRGTRKGRAAQAVPGSPG